MAGISRILRENGGHIAVLICRQEGGGAEAVWGFEGGADAGCAALDWGGEEGGGGCGCGCIGCGEEG